MIDVPNVTHAAPSDAAPAIAPGLPTYAATCPVCGTVRTPDPAPGSPCPTCSRPAVRIKSRPWEPAATGWPPPPTIRRSAARRARIARRAVAAAGLIALVAGLTDLGGLLSGHLAVATPSFGPLVDADLWFSGLLAIAGLLAALISGASFIAWLMRAQEEVVPLTGWQPLHTRAGAAGWWFVPFANWVMPYRVLRDLHRQVDTEGAARNTGMSRLWWLFWSAAAIIGIVDFQLGRTPGVPVAAQLSVPAVREFLLAAAAVLAVRVIDSIQRAEDRLAELAISGQTTATNPTPAPWEQLPRPAVVVSPMSVRYAAFALALVALLIAGMAYATTLSTVLASGSARWASFSPPDSTFTMEFPGQVSSKPRIDGRGTIYSVSGRNVYSSVTVVDLGRVLDPDEVFDSIVGELPADYEMNTSGRYVQDGLKAREIQLRNKRAGEWVDLRLVTAKGLLIMVMVSSYDWMPADALRVLQSFHLGASLVPHY